MGKKKVKLEGNLVSELKKLEDCFKINRFQWTTEKLNLNLNGKFFNDNTVAINLYTQGDIEEILYPILKDLSIKGFIYSYSQINKDKTGKITVNGRYKSPLISSGGEEFTSLNGKINWDNIDKTYNINCHFNDGDLKSQLKVSVEKKLNKIFVKRVSAEKLTKMIRIYNDIPTGSIIAEGNISLKKRQMNGTLLLEKQKKIINQFNLEGKLNFQFNTKTKAFKFHSDKMYSEFGKSYLTGESIPREKKLIIKVNSDLNDVGNINKYTVFFIDLDLSPWNLQSGKGKFNLNLKKNGKNVNYHSSLHFNDFYSHKQKISSLRGKISGESGINKGIFHLNDKHLTGQARLHLDKNNIKIDFPNLKGEARKILRILDIDILLFGRIQGDLVYYHDYHQIYPKVTGDIQAEKLDFYGLKFDKIRSTLESNLEYIHLKNFECWYKGGPGQADIFIDYIKEKYKISGSLKNINLNKMTNELTGQGRISFRGQGNFSEDPIKADFSINDIYYYKDRIFHANGKADIYTDFSAFNIAANGKIMNISGESPFTLDLSQKDGLYQGDFKLNLKDINLLIPWKNNSGTMELTGEFSNPSIENVEIKGLANFNGQVLTFPNFPHALENFQAFVTFENTNFTLQSLQGEIGKGQVSGNGYITIEEKALKDLLLNLTGKNMILYPMDRTSCRMNADVSMKYINQKLLLQGTLNFLSAIWEREIDEEISFYTNPELTPTESKIMDMLQYDLKLIAKDDFLMTNSFGRVSGKFDLKLIGDPDFPIILGTIESRDGEINFSDRKFKLIKGKMIFNSKLISDPVLNIESETFIKNYHIKFNIDGTAFHPKPAFQSAPPLPPNDILALISLGELFERPSSSEQSLQVGTTGLITSKLTEQIKKRAQKLFGIDLLKFDPIMIGSSLEGSSRLTVGKSIFKNILIVYSTDISTLRQEVLYLHYQLSPSISLIGMRNEEGRYSFDIRFRKRH